MLWVLEWHPKHAYLCTLWARKGVFGYLQWWCLKRSMPTNMLWVLGWRLRHAYLCTLWARNGVFGYLQWWCSKRTMPKDLLWVLGWRPMVFETHQAEKYAVSFGVAPQTRIPGHPLGQKRCFWVPTMVVFETHHAKKYAGVLGWRPKHAYLCKLWARKGFLDA